MQRTLLLLISLFVCYITEAQITPTDYSNQQNWAAGKMKTFSLINYNPSFTIVGPDTVTKTIVPATPDTSSDYDIFFVYPTILTGFGAPATYPINLINKSAANIEINWEATAFEQFGRLYAPYYRQGNLATFYPNTSFALQSAIFDTAATDVLAAFKYYMDNYNNGKKVILVGHSQGAVILAMVLRQMEINPTYAPYLNKIFISVIMGMESGPYISQSSFTGGWLQNIPLCQNPADTACIMSWATHRYNAPLLTFTNLVPFDTDLVKAGLMYENFDSTIHRVFMDPLGFTTVQKPIKFSIYPKALFKNVTNTDYGVTTDFIGYTNMYYGSISNPDIKDYGFMVGRIPGIANDNRLDPLTISISNDYHVYDAYVGIGDVICLIYQKMGKACPYSFLATSSDNMDGNTDFLLFPNPATAELNLTLPDERINSITIYNVLGKEILKTGKATQLDVSPLVNGIYFISLTTGSKTWKRVFVKE